MEQQDALVIQITDPDQDRYARLRLLEGYRQETLAGARVLVVGAGALGNEVLKNLALLGAGRVLIVDRDTIALSNLTRSILFRAEDCGRPKVAVACERVQQINPDVRAIGWCADVVHGLGHGVLRRVDLVLGCLDNRAARLALNRLCWHTGTPWIDGALSAGDGTLRIFRPPAGACYECLMTRQDQHLLALSYACPAATLQEGLALTTPMSASIIGAMQVQEAVKLLHGIPVKESQGVVYSAETLRTLTMSYPRRADCPAHETWDAVISLPQGTAEVTVGALLERAAADLGRPAVLELWHPVVRYGYCARCDALEPLYRPQWQVVPGAVPCPVCGQERTFDVASTIGISAQTRDIPLAQLGVPPLEIVKVRAGGEQIYYELGGDATAVLVGW